MPILLKISGSWIWKIDFTSILTRCFVSLITLSVALTVNGNWLIILAHVSKQFGFRQLADVDFETFERILTSWRLKDFSYFWICSSCVGFSVYFLLGYGFHWYYYILRRDQSEEWKCQPNRWLSKELEWQEIKEGSVSLFVTNAWSSFIACYIHNDGYSTVYYKLNEYGVLWWILQFPVIFIWMDYSAYWMHRIFHMPFLYKRFHKLHHRFVQPTAFSVTAIHPIEISIMQIVMMVPLFTVPTHWVVYQTLAVYVYYHGILTHSGINFKRQWWQPWQANAAFHDNHHQYFHVNFGFNCELWDKLHGTYRQPNRIYNEKIFYGRGKSIEEVNTDELKHEIMERSTESHSAYEDGINPYLFNNPSKLVLNVEVDQKMAK